MEPVLQLEIVPSVQNSPFYDYRIGKQHLQKEQVSRCRLNLTFAFTLIFQPTYPTSSKSLHTLQTFAHKERFKHKDKEACKLFLQLY
jgi:hypothetical protein